MGSDLARPFCVTVYGSSSSGVDPSYKQAAFDVGKAIAEQGWIQCNGGGKYGLMGAATEGGLTAGGMVDCVILEKFVASNMHDGAFRDIVVEETMTLRKAGLYSRADAFICLPGGLGTLEEASEVMSWLQLGMHTKPYVGNVRLVVFVNTNGYYDDFWRFYSRGIKESFVCHACNNAIFLVSDHQHAIRAIQRYQPLFIDKQAILAGNLNADWNSKSSVQ